MSRELLQRGFQVIRSWFPGRKEVKDPAKTIPDTIPEGYVLEIGVLVGDECNFHNFDPHSIVDLEQREDLMRSVFLRIERIQRSGRKETVWVKDPLGKGLDRQTYYKVGTKEQNTL